MGDAVTTRYWIPERNIEPLVDAIHKLARRALKLSSEPIALNLTGAERFEEYSRTDESGRKRAFMVRDVEIELRGGTPRMNGWGFAAALTHDAETQRNVLRTAPWFAGTLPERYRTAGATCEHCQLDRMRKDTYIVAHEDGRFSQVGRQCLKDFTGHHDPHALASYAEMLMTAAGLCGEAGDESWSMGGREHHWWAIESVVSIALVCIRQYGWTSVADAGPGQCATKSDVLGFLLPTQGQADAAARFLREHETEADGELARVIVAYCLEMDASSDYLWNLQTIAVKGRVDMKTLGMAVSMPRCYSRELARRAERLQAGDSAWFGETGKRDVFRLVVTDKREMPGDYGVTTLVKFVDGAGNRAKWFASGSVAYGIGAEYLVRATVKGHGDWKGAKETQLSRVVEMTEEELAAEVAKADRKRARAEKKLARELVAA